MNYRRFCLLSCLARARAGERGVSSAWRALHDLEPATALDEDFPARSKLVAAGYDAVEDLDGATEDELRDNVPTLTRREISAVLAAL